MSAKIALARDLIIITSRISWTAVVQHEAIVARGDVEIRPDREGLNVPALSFAVRPVRATDEEKPRESVRIGGWKIEMTLRQLGNSITEQEE